MPKKQLTGDLVNDKMWSTPFVVAGMGITCGSYTWLDRRGAQGWAGQLVGVHCGGDSSLLLCQLGPPNAATHAAQSPSPPQPAPAGKGADHYDANRRTFGQEGWPAAKDFVETKVRSHYGSSLGAHRIRRLRARGPRFVCASCSNPPALQAPSLLLTDTGHALVDALLNTVRGGLPAFIRSSMNGVPEYWGVSAAATLSCWSCSVDRVLGMGLEVHFGYV